MKIQVLYYNSIILNDIGMIKRTQSAQYTIIL